MASKTRHNLRTKHYFANTRIKIQEKENSYLHLHLIHPWAAVAVYTDTNILPYTSLAHPHRSIIMVDAVVVVSVSVSSLYMHVDWLNGISMYTYIYIISTYIIEEADYTYDLVVHHTAFRPPSPRSFTWIFGFCVARLRDVTTPISWCGKMLATEWHCCGL